MTEPFETIPGWSRAAFRSAVTQNLAAGAFRLIIAVDEITDELNRTVAFLNSRRTPLEVRLLALELRRAADEGVEILVLEEGVEGRAPTKRKPYDRERLIGGIRARSAGAALTAEDLLDWGKRQGLKVRYTVSEGVVAVPGGGTLFRIVGHHELVRVSLRSVRSRGKPGADERVEQLLTDLDKFGMTIKGNHAKAPLESLAQDEGKRTEFKVVMKRALEIMAGGSPSLGSSSR